MAATVAARFNPILKAFYQRLVAAGYRSRLEPFDAWWGQRYASVYDPDGNGADIAAPLPTAEESA